MKTAPHDTVIITAFEVFGKYHINPTEVMAKSLDKRFIDGNQIKSLVFPTNVLEIDGSPNPTLNQLKTVINTRHKAIISFGLDSGAKGIKFERIGINWVENSKYCQPHEQRQALDKGRAAKEKRQVDLAFWKLDQIRGKMRIAGIPFETEISDNANAFCCNALIYRVLDYMEDLGIKIPFLFLHVPCTREAIKGYSGFDVNKTIIKQSQLEQVVQIVLSSIVSE